MINFDFYIYLIRNIPIVRNYVTFGPFKKTHKSKNVIGQSRQLDLQISLPYYDNEEVNISSVL
jgi:hypothetical protein